MTSFTTVVPLRQPDTLDENPLTAILRSGARQLPPANAGRSRKRQRPTSMAKPLVPTSQPPASLHKRK